MSMVGALKKELENLKEKHGIEISAIVSRSGVPIVWNMPDETHLETFATLSATIVGASEVVYAGLGKDPPTRIITESKSGVFLAHSLSSKAILAIISNSTDVETLSNALEESIKNIKEVLADEQARL